MGNSIKKQFADGGHNQDGGMQQRRIGRIVHDERGNASVDWMEAPSGYKRQVFELEGDASALSIQKAPRTFDPYANATLPEPKKTTAPRKDLRKLSEWIKMMRELEERKRSETAD